MCKYNPMLTLKKETFDKEEMQIMYKIMIIYLAAFLYLYFAEQI